jgi:large subunit ribosomal protein L29
MKATDVRNLNTEELEERLRALREELFNFKFRLVTQQIENPIRMRHVRRDIARIMTVLRERELPAGRNKAPAGGK